MKNELLGAIIPQGEIACLARVRMNPGTDKPIPWTHRFVDPTKESLDEVLDTWAGANDIDFYFAVAGFQEKGARTAQNVAHIKCLVLDVDIKADDPKFYSSKKQALKALRKVCNRHQVLPKPWVVDSGGGLHIYFELDEPLELAEWQPLARGFRDTVRRSAKKLVADPKRTIDAASVLRIPGTVNTKFTPAAPVRLLMKGKPGDTAKINAALGRRSEAPVFSPVAGTLLPGAAPSYARADGEVRSLFGDQPLKDLPLEEILEGCAQMRFIAEVEGNVPEPEWLLGLRVIATVKDPEKTAYALSKGHPTYSATETLRKLRHAQSAFEVPSAACKEFKELQPQKCAKCPYKGKVWSPSQIPLARQAPKKVAQAEQVALQAATASPVQRQGHLALSSLYKREKTDTGTEITLFPIELKDSAGFEKALMKAHLYLKPGTVETTYQNDEGRVKIQHRDVHVHVDVVVNGRRTSLSIPAEQLSQERLDASTKTLRDAGVVFEAETPAETKALRKYLRHLVNVTMAGKPASYRPAKGWIEEYPFGKRPLTLGARHYKPNGKILEGCTWGEHVGDNDGLFIERFCSGRPVGRLEEWQAGMEIYNAPDMELTQMLLLSGLANMLLPIVSNQRGGMLLVLAGRTGIGKTTLLRFMGSFIGDPAHCMVPGSSTTNALVNMLKQAHFFTLPVDDTMRLDAQQVTLLLSSVSSGMEKMRLSSKGSSGVYSTEWAAPFYSSLLVTTQYSVEATLGTGGAESAQLQTDAARSRLLELPAAHIVHRTASTSDWLAAEQRVSANYGHAVALMADYLVRHQTSVHTVANELRAKLEQRLVGKSSFARHGVARFWARYIACVGITAYILCDRLKLLSWDRHAIVESAVKYVTSGYIEAQEDKEQTLSTLWDIFTDSLDGRIRINFSYMKGDASKASGTEWPAWDDMTRSAQQRRRHKTTWDTDTRAAGVMNSLRIDSPINPATMGRPARWRVVLTSVRNSKRTLQVERCVEIPLNTLTELVDRHARQLRVGSWEELYYVLEMNACVVKGVKPEKPNSYGRAGEQVRAALEETKAQRGEDRWAVRITFPPLAGSVVDPDD